MRITGGEWCGRRIRVPRAGVRPTQDRVREALFSVLGDRIPGARVLDLFAGSGVIGLEALSRGAASVCWVEVDRRVDEVLRGNVLAFDAEAGNPIVCADAVRALRSGRVGSGYDVVFADPPYEAGNAAPVWRLRLLEALSAADAVRPGGWFVLEEASPKRKNDDGGPECPAGWRCIKEKRYGNTKLVFIEKVGGVSEDP